MRSAERIATLALTSLVIGVFTAGMMRAPAFRTDFAGRQCRLAATLFGNPLAGWTHAGGRGPIRS